MYTFPRIPAAPIQKKYKADVRRSCHDLTDEAGRMCGTGQAQLTAEKMLGRPSTVDRPLILFQQLRDIRTQPWKKPTTLQSEVALVKVSRRIHCIDQHAVSNHHHSLRD